LEGVVVVMIDVQFGNLAEDATQINLRSRTPTNGFGKK